MFLFIIIALPVLHIAWWWIVHRRLRHAARARLLKWGHGIVAGGLLGVFAFVIGTRIMRLATDVSTPMMALTYVWFLIVLPTTWIALMPIAGVAGAVSWLRCDPRSRRGDPGGNRLAQEPVAADATDDSADASGFSDAESIPITHPSRRAVLTAVVGLAPPVAALGGTLRSLAQLDDFRIRRLTVVLPTLPPPLDGMTIVNVSDTHVGKFTNGATLRKIADAANALRPDLMVLTGDLIDHSLADLPAGLDMVRRLDAPGGVFMCEGNHDLFEGRSEFESRVVRAGVPLLLNQAAVVRVRGEQIQMLGLRWGRLPDFRASDNTVDAANPPVGESSSRPAVPSGAANRKSTAADIPASSHAKSAPSRGAGIDENMSVVISRRDPEAFAILLAHHPHAFDPAADAGIPLTLAGHTHGGQLMLSEALGAGPLLYRYWSGLYTRNNCALVVSNGVGNWFPMRLNAPAEIVHLTLRRAPSVDS